jgi:hypothetical protein
MSDVLLEPIDRGRPLVATRSRWLLSAGALAAGFVIAVEAYLCFAHVGRMLVSFAWLIGLVATAVTGLVLAILRAEESRLTRELRTARTGTSVLRGLVARRHRQVPFLARLFSTQLGVAAILLADGDRDGAIDVLARGSSILMRGGRLDGLRAIVEADLERSAGTPAGLERCVEQLRALEPLENREADLYRTHVLVKALLEQGDADGAVDVLGALEPSQDDEQKLYVAWLRVWFDLDVETDYRHAWPALPEGQLRMATLLARAHGAEKLVAKLEQRVSAIARPHHQG